ncbi:MAG TPA: o-succinylbenzoate synthase [Actinomycetota bacterium]|nr:o-succinylbenzoate synthase [Actinomycetota bacterium]
MTLRPAPGLAEAAELLLVRLPLVRPFTTSFGTTSVKEAIVVRAIGSDGVEGWGECVAAEHPLYSAEWNAAAWAVLRDYLIPAALEGRPAGIRGHPMARAALETAVLDLRLRRAGTGLAAHLGGIRDRVPCGVSLGIEERVEDLLEQVAAFAAAGYRRVKLKIEPGRDVDVVREVRSAFPDLPLTVDANAAYTPETVEAIVPFDELGLEYIEQPLAEDDLVGHAALQRRLETPLCLDETITSATVARGALEVGACRVINIKVGRVGGLRGAVAIHDLARDAGVPVWCGGMLETGIGRAANVAIASLPGFTMPGDTSASARYFERDLTEPFVVDADGTMAVPAGPGIGVEPLPDVLAEATVERLTIR